jgi:hypothetical protein
MMSRKTIEKPENPTASAVGVYQDSSKCIKSNIVKRRTKSIKNKIGINNK